MEDSSDADFTKTVKLLHESAKKLGNISDVMERITRESLAPLKDAGVKLREAGEAIKTGMKVILPGGALPAPTPATPSTPPPKPTKPSEVEDGFFKRRWDASRLGRAYKNATEGYERYFWGKTTAESSAGSGGRAATHGPPAPTPGAGGSKPHAPKPPASAGGAGAAGGAGRAVGVATKAVGAVGVVVAAAQALNEFRKAIHQASEEALRSAQKYAEVSASMAKVMAQKEVRDMRRDMAIGEATAGSTDKLSQAVSKRQDAQASFEIGITNVKNQVLEWFEDKIGDSMETFRQWVNKLIETISGGLIKDFFPKVDSMLAGDPFGYEKSMLEAAKLDGRRLSDIAAATVARVKAGLSAPAGAAPLGKLP